MSSDGQVVFLLHKVAHEVSILRTRTDGGRGAGVHDMLIPTQLAYCQPIVEEGNTRLRIEPVHENRF